MGRSGRMFRQVGIRVPSDLDEQLHIVSDFLGWSLSQTCRCVLSDFFVTHSKQTYYQMAMSLLSELGDD